MDIKQLITVGDRLFTDRLSYMSFQQELAENFYPERADFTVQKTLGEQYAADLNTSYPILVRRELGDQIGQMLRPTAKEWFSIKPPHDEKLDNAGKRWQENRSSRMRAAMYSRPAKFTRATKSTDHDFATFGGGIMSCRLNKYHTNLLYRNFHLRDVAWMEDEEDETCMVVRKWLPTCRDLANMFPQTYAKKLDQKIKKDPFSKVKCFHIVVKSEMYDINAGRMPWVSLAYDVENKKLMEEVPLWVNEYIIPCWQRVSGSQYPFSPASITAIPEARMIQSMAWTLLEAGEKATNPPMIATQDVVRSDVAMYAGGITWVDKSFDGKLNEALRPITQDLRGLPFGLDMIEDSRALLSQAFFLNKLAMPDRAPEMTAYEVGQRIQEYIRGALPLFEPMEDNYNGSICQVTFDTLLHAGVLGSPDEIPPSIINEGVDFEYRSPLHDAIEEQLGQKFFESQALIAEAMQIDRAGAFILDTREAMRESLTSIGVPARWLHSRDDVDQLVNQADQAEQETAQLENMAKGAEIANSLGQAGQNLELV